MKSPSRLMSQDMILFSCPPSVLMWLKVFACHILQVLSYEDVTKYLPCVGWCHAANHDIISHERLKTRYTGQHHT